VNTTVSADAKFLRRVLLALVMLTLMAGGMAAFTTARATANDPACQIACE
jgi:hypothetical protein